MPTPIELLGLAPKREVAPQEDGTFDVYVTPPPMLYSRPTPICINLTSDQYDRYCKWRIGGGLIQDHLGDLSPGAREFLLSGLTPAEFEALKPKDDEDDV